jgi:hypothetical protein
MRIYIVQVTYPVNLEDSRGFSILNSFVKIRSNSILIFLRVYFSDQTAFCLISVDLNR